MRRRKLILPVVGAIIATIAALAWLSSQPPASAVAVAFIAYTNAPTGERMAMFRITNDGRRQTRRWNVYNIESREQPTWFSTLSLQAAPTAIQPGQSELFTIPAPEGSRTWRLTVSVSPDGWRRRFCDWIRQPSGRFLYAIIPSRLRVWPSGFGRSDWIDQ